MALEKNGVIINDLIINDLVSKIDNPRFKLYDLFSTLENFLHADEIKQLLEIGHSTYYKYKREKSSKYVERKLYELFLQIDFK